MNDFDSTGRDANVAPNPMKEAGIKEKALVDLSELHYFH